MDEAGVALDTDVAFDAVATVITGFTLPPLDTAAGCRVMDRIPQDQKLRVSVAVEWAARHPLDDRYDRAAMAEAVAGVGPPFLAPHYTARQCLNVEKNAALPGPLLPRCLRRLGSSTRPEARS